ncbi:MAG TPA: sugar ABC transporter permease, partial [Erysipelothrix sp.]
MGRKNEHIGYLFIAPWLLGFVFLTLGPLLFSLLGSFTNYDVTSTFDFIGITNYKQMLFHDNLFWTALFNTLYYIIFSLPITIFLTIVLSHMLAKEHKGIRLLRTIYYLPAVLSGVGVYILWMQLLDPSTGLVNILLGFIGIKGPSWLTDPAWTKNALILMKLWSVGGGMLMYISSMQGISKSIYEAAALEGVGPLRRFFSITLPLISPVIFFDIVMSLIGGFQIFQEAYVMSTNGAGGPANSLLFYNLYMWNKAFKSFDMG